MSNAEDGVVDFKDLASVNPCQILRSVLNLYVNLIFKRLSRSFEEN